jgi:hypothetical protein
LPTGPGPFRVARHHLRPGHWALADATRAVIVGLVLMVLWWWRSPAFFRNRPEVFEEGTPAT